MCHCGMRARRGMAVAFEALQPREQRGIVELLRSSVERTTSSRSQRYMASSLRSRRAKVGDDLLDR